MGDSALRVRRAYAAAGFGQGRADVVPFIARTWEAFESADLIVSRCGSTTLAELTCAGRPAILVPFAAATHDHQTFNARKLADAGAAVMIAESDLSGEKLASTVIDLIGNDEKLARMSAASRALGRPDAAARIADLCVELMAGGKAA
jgi:UDP-N-acetylglucosamine--N-acetylmuramyl-(pentapeptide) pyrophosphoryl-undecaprenol N-acetylglucosamine transferase